MSKLVPYLFILPFFLAFALFTLYPTITGVLISFYDWSGYGEKVYVGLANYIDALTNPYFYKPLCTSMLLMITGPIITIIALLMAVLLNMRKGKLNSFCKVVYFMPYIAMPVAVAILFKIILQDQGIFNSLLTMLGLDPVHWLSNPDFVIFNINLILLWRYMGYHMIIYLGGLQSIDPTLYEAARIDGAKNRHIITKIILPLMVPFIVFMMLTIITGSLGLFDEPMMLYGANGGTEGAGQTLGMYIYFNIFGGNPRWGYGTAVSTIMCFICVVLALIVYKIKQLVER